MTVEQVVYFYNKIFFDHFKDLWPTLEPNNYVIAGGAVRDKFVKEKVKDIDIFTNSKGAAVALFKAMLLSGGIDMNADKNLNDDRPLFNVKFKDRWFQIINTVYYNTETTETIENFDFTICGAQVSSKGFHCLPTFFQDLATKHLRINKAVYPLSTLERMQKYIKKGYSACNGSLLELAKLIREVDFDNPEENRLEMYPDGSPRFVGID